jgi:DNA-binding transcriptional ArsR family regulator
VSHLLARPQKQKAQELNPPHPNKTGFVGVWYSIDMKGLKSSKQMERHLKGVANHYRIEILLLVADDPGITLENIIEKLKARPTTIGEHVRKLYNVGLVNKKYRSKFVEHTLSPYGKMFVRFLKEFQKQ